MKKTLVAVACAAFISTGAMAAPSVHHNTPRPHNAPTHTMNHHAKPAIHAHTGHHNPTPYVAHVHSAPSHHHHHHHSYNNTVLLGDALISMAILALALN